jgi:hypothetical protein
MEIFVGYVRVVAMVAAILRPMSSQSNVLVSRDGTAKLSDFGLSRFLEEVRALPLVATRPPYDLCRVANALAARLG